MIFELNTTSSLKKIDEKEKERVSNLLESSENNIDHHQCRSQNHENGIDRKNSQENDDSANEEQIKSNSDKGMISNTERNKMNLGGI